MCVHVCLSLASTIACQDDKLLLHKTLRQQGPGMEIRAKAMVHITTN